MKNSNDVMMTSLVCVWLPSEVFGLISFGIANEICGRVEYLKSRESLASGLESDLVLLIVEN